MSALQVEHVADASGDQAGRGHQRIHADWWRRRLESGVNQRAELRLPLRDKLRQSVTDWRCDLVTIDTRPLIDTWIWTKRAGADEDLGAPRDRRAADNSAVRQCLNHGH